MRVSNFLLWQISYAELVITPTLWPDFKRRNFLPRWKNMRDGIAGLAEFEKIFDRRKKVVEPERLELSTPTMPLWCSTN